MKSLLFFLCLLIIAFLLLTIFVANINNDKQKEKLKLWLFNQKLITKFGQTKQFANVKISDSTAILGSQNKEINLPQSYTLHLSKRKQVFNLSCEFAAAAAVIHYFSNNNFFASSNELAAEKTLMEQIGVSQNPNIGIRMGSAEQNPEGQNSEGEESLEALYFGLGQKFGGTDYYGVHAPPFIELFEKYNLMARPVNSIEEIKKAIFSGHLVMAWIKIGYGESVDVALSYGATKVVKGEHAVIIFGYNQKEFIVMDPGIGSIRHVPHDTLMHSAKDFSMPFLEVYPSVFKTAYDPTEGVDIITGLDRNALKIEVKNGSKIIGLANNMGQILHDFGYHIISIGRKENWDYEGVTILMKKEFKDYEGLIKKDIALSGYKISSFSADLKNDSRGNVLVIVSD